MQINLGRAFVQLGRTTEGERVLHQVHLDPDSVTAGRDARLLLGKLYMQSQHMDRADAMFTAALQEDPHNAAAMAGLGKVLLVRDSDVGGARVHMVKAHQLNPNDEMILFELGMVLFYSDQHEEGKAAFDRAAEINPSLDLSIIGRVYLHYQHQDWAEVVLDEYYLRATQESAVSPVDSTTLLLLAETKDFMGKPAAAHALYTSVLAVEPDNGLAHAALGLLLLGTGARNFAAINACGLNQHEAMQHLQRAVQLNPEIVRAQEALDFCREELEV